MNPADIQNRLSGTSIARTALADSCPDKQQHTCQPEKYRHATSLCNNVQNPTWGSAETSYGQLLPASYSDGNNCLLTCSMSHLVFSCCILLTGISQVRMAASGKPLPSPFKITESIHAPKKAGNGYLTTLSAVWAQFILNDISSPISFAGMYI